MVSADAELANTINSAAAAYLTSPPAYITCIERTHIDPVLSFPAIDINRSLAVRVADNYAAMRDLPQGKTETGKAFPIIPFFDPFSNFRFSYYANFFTQKRLDITVTPGAPYRFELPQPDASVQSLVPYFSFVLPTYAADSSDSAPHLLVAPTPRTPSGSMLWTDVRVDATTDLPTEVTLSDPTMTIILEYAMVQNHWVITRGTFVGSQHVLGNTFTVHASTTFTDFAFPSTPPDPALAGSPSPTTSP